MKTVAERTIQPFPQGPVCNFTVPLLILWGVPGYYVLCQLYHSNILKQALNIHVPTLLSAWVNTVLKTGHWYVCMFMCWHHSGQNQK